MAARLRRSQAELASAASVGMVTVRQFEGRQAEPRRSTLDVLTRALEAAGVQFIPENVGGPGVRLQKEKGLDQHIERAESGLAIFVAAG